MVAVLLHAYGPGPMNLETCMLAWDQARVYISKRQELIYTSFKDAAIKMSQITPEIQTLLNFKQKLDDLGHFYTIYSDINDLKFKFNGQLSKILPGLTGISQSVIEQHDEP